MVTYTRKPSAEKAETSGSLVVLGQLVQSHQRAASVRDPFSKHKVQMAIKILSVGWQLEYIPYIPKYSIVVVMKGEGVIPLANFKS